jgi:uncharacterized protein (TIGR03437 family)
MRRAGWLLLATSLAWGANCSRTSAGFTPLSDPYPRSYQGFQVSLYPDGAQPPAAHLALGLKQAAAVTPRDPAGAPDANGRIVLLSIGMSNTTQEFSAFIPLATADPLRNRRVQPIDGAFGGWTAARILAQSDEYWSMVDQRLKSGNATANQVQVAWLKLADSQPAAAFPNDALTLEDEAQAIGQQARARFPNLAIAYLSSRIYAGYATTALNPEPFAYQTGFAVKWLIERQISGAPQLDVASGKAPWLAWGPYLWADGLKPRFDGLTWNCSDVRADDGTHPSPAGQQKVARMLLDFLHSDPTARPWYLAPASPPKPVLKGVVNSAGYGEAIATGSLASIFGTGLAGSTAQADGFPLPHELAGTRVEVDGFPALLYYVSPEQINFVFPATGGQSLAVARSENTSAAVKPAAGFWAPGLFTLDGAANGPAAAAHLDGTVVSSAKPALPGETIQFYGTGVGFVNPMLLIAVPAPIVTVGSARAAVLYSGPAPGIPGVTQLNVTIPADAPAGPAVPVIFQLGANSSNAATVGVGK